MPPSELEPEPRPSFDDKIAVELRGYEVARRVDDAKTGVSWMQIAHYRPNTYGFNEAKATAKILCERNPSFTYRIRPIVSLEPPQPDQVDVKESTNG